MRVLTYTGSLPTGFYQKVASDKIKKADLISFCLKTNIAKYGYNRGYINKGSCQDGYSPLLKEIIAVPGDSYTITSKELIVNGLHYTAPSTYKDEHQLDVKRFITNGKYTATGYLVYGYGSPKYSWDSRYYGQIQKNQIISKYKPLLIF